MLIIGATSVIGEHLALQYAAAGHKVGATGRRLELLEKLQAAYPEHIHILQHDVTSPSQMVDMAAFVEQLGGVDVMVYNSGVGHFNKNIDWAPEENTIAINVSGFTETATWAYRYFRERGGGQFVGMSSMASIILGSPTAPAYAASKAFISSYMASLRAKAKYDKLLIYITDVRPGFVDTACSRTKRDVLGCLPGKSSGPNSASYCQAPKSGIRYPPLGTDGKVGAFLAVSDQSVRRLLG
ncbi:MAG: SDR family NAD(P)-dependent oxidoreductase [Lewinellaceae bacterium]|nr:SDR family NAD(P)-dependent oxidoreductase [Lewinellaceae bacterium]